MEETFDRNLAPRWYHRWVFWCVLSALSAFFAEVCCGNEPFVLLTADSWIFCVSMYGLHTILLATIVCREGTTTFSRLFLAGALFGMYEAYMTKVIWAGWEAGAFQLAGVAVVETLMLVLFWHPFMAFTVPLFMAERFLLSSSTLARTLRPFFQRAACGVWFPLLILPFLGGLFDGITLASLPGALYSTVSNGFVLIFLVVLWKKGLQGDRFPLALLLPRRWEFVGLALLLLGQYVLFGFVFHPENMPGLGPQATVWFMYVFFIALLVLAMKKKAFSAALVVSRCPKPGSVSQFLLFIALFVIGGCVGGALLWPLRDVIFAVLFIFGIPFGCFVFCRVLYRLVFITDEENKVES